MVRNLFDRRPPPKQWHRQNVPYSAWHKAPSQIFSPKSMQNMIFGKNLPKMLKKKVVFSTKKLTVWRGGRTLLVICLGGQTPHLLYKQTLTCTLKTLLMRGGVSFGIWGEGGLIWRALVLHPSRKKVASLKNRRDKWGSDQQHTICTPDVIFRCDRWRLSK